MWACLCASFNLLASNCSSSFFNQLGIPFCCSSPEEREEGGGEGRGRGRERETRRGREREEKGRGKREGDKERESIIKTVVKT